MKFERLRIRGFKSHDDTELSLRSGVTVIHGVNGSGKSSLLEACFFALYGSAAIDGTLDDAIANDAEEMDVVLSFTHDGADYRVEREVKRRGETAQTTTCVLETPDGPIDGVTDVEAHIEELLRMDADAFVNCAYVRQGEVNKLINASPGERQDMIDDLLQLGKLETYRERASDARVGVKRVRDRKRELLADRNRTIEAKEDKDLHGRLNALESELSELEAQIEAKETERANAEKTLENAEATLEEYEERQTELDELKAEIEELTETIAETERERDRIESQIRSHRETTDELEADLEALLADVPDSADGSVEPLGDTPDPEAVSDRIADLDERADDVREAIETHRLNAQQHTNDAENATERAVELKEQATEARKEADELDSEIDSVREKLDERRERLEEMDDEIEQLQETLAAGPVPGDELDAHRESVREEIAGKRERLAGRRTERKNAKESLRDAERLREEGKCPECGQPVDGSPHLEHVEADRERVDELDAEIDSLEAEIDSLEEDEERLSEFIETADELDSLVDNRDTVQSLLEQREETIAEKTERVESLRSEAEEYESQAEEYESKAADYRSEIGELNGKKSRIDERRHRLERIESLLSEITETEREIETLRERRENAAELNDQRRERLSEKRARSAELEESFNEAAIDKATNDKQRAETYLSKVEPFLDEKRAERDELQNEIGAVKNELDELETLKTQREELEATVERLESLYDEAARLQETYESLRGELRQRNVNRLETMLNELFDLVYQNDSYSRIELDGEYQLTVYQKDDTPLDPDQLSGGERALFNLSLRCAIYRLLSEGIEGQAPTPPLILDEPTVFLDSGHVSKLVELIDSMTQHGVAQIIVVSHDEELVGAADDLIAVRKDPTTNRSSVERTARADALQ